MVLDEDQTLGQVPKVPSSYYVEKIEVFLHPTFTPNRLVLTGEPFEIKRVGFPFRTYLVPNSFLVRLVGEFLLFGGTSILLRDSTSLLWALNISFLLIEMGRTGASLLISPLNGSDMRVLLGEEKRRQRGLTRFADGAICFVPCYLFAQTCK